MATRWDPVNYHSHRLSPPAELISLIAQVHGQKTADCVVDLGCGTGLSTTAWTNCATEVVGIDPSPEMLQVADAHCLPTVKYKLGKGERIPLPNNCVDIVACVSAIHWMEPRSTAREVFRILKEPGFFVVLAHDWPPRSDSSELTDKYAQFIQRLDELTARYAIPQVLPRYLNRVQFESLVRSEQIFAHSAEFDFCECRQLTASQLVDLVASRGTFQRLMHERSPEAMLLLDEFRAEANERLSEQPTPMWITWRTSLFSNSACHTAVLSQRLGRDPQATER